MEMKQDTIYIPDTIAEFLEIGGVKNPDVFPAEMDIYEAIRKMNTKGFSQVPVCIHERVLQGYLSWDGIFRGICKNRESFSGTVSDYCSKSLDSKIISMDSQLRDALTRILDNEFLIVVDSFTELNVMGIITISDLSHLYSTILQGYTLIRDIEIRLRKIISAADIKIKELRALSQNKELEAVNELSLGNFCFIMNNNKVWPRLSISRSLDQNYFYQEITEIKNIRNQVMHNNWLSCEGASVRQDIMHLQNFLNLLDSNM